MSTFEDVPQLRNVENNVIGSNSGDVPCSGHVENDTPMSNSGDVPQLRDVKIELIGDSNEHLLPSKVLENVNSNVEIEGEFTNTISYYPIWKWDGNRNYHRTKHWIHFDLLVYILSNVFVQFRKEFMTLITVELQLSNVKNSSLEDTTSLREMELEKRLELANKKIGDLESEVQILNSNLIESNKLNIELKSKLESTSSDLDEAITHIKFLDNKIDGLNGRIDTLNHKLRTFTPSNSTTNSIHIYLRLYLSERHTRNPEVRAKAINGKLWIGIYCGEISNYSRTIRDPRARSIVTYPINSRDSLVYISDIIGDDFIMDSNYKHWLIESRSLPDIIDQIAQVLIDHNAIDGQIELNNDVLDSIIEVEPEAIIQEVEPDPITVDQIPNEYNFDELSGYEYYFRKHYRRIQQDESNRRLYFYIGNGKARVREYIIVSELSRMVRRPIN